ncbi:hypothetical protein [Xanthocytophaga agilis]|uniref:Uncharacterized protein n=1 Tax=Xanthocytophaga agilis TaxID=3048010 RepID=A0AAE3UCT4_9BACT|nr:hypothetical protein [Xanthocytophaga agilis]MDJ1501193.1 hypothetical protein [Xanthocytophaga agilis]
MKEYDPLLKGMYANPPIHITEVLPGWSPSERINFIAYTLGRYGGSVGHELLIQIVGILHDFSLENWKELLESITLYGKHLGEQTLFGFFVLYTPIDISASQSVFKPISWDVDYFLKEGLFSRLLDMETDEFELYRKTISERTLNYMKVPETERVLIRSLPLCFERIKVTT